MLNGFTDFSVAYASDEILFDAIQTETGADLIIVHVTEIIQFVSFFKERWRYQ